MDVSIYKPLSIFLHPFLLGGTIKNIAHTGVSWSTGHTDTVPIITTIGTATHFFDRRLTLSADLEKEGNYDLDSYLGTEFWIMGGPKKDGSLAFRAGAHRSDITLGIGFITEGLIFDYAYRNPSLSILEPDHRFSIGWTSFPFRHNDPPKKEKKPSYYTTSSTPTITHSRPTFNKRAPMKTEPTPTTIVVGKILYLPQQNPIIKFENISTDFNFKTTTHSLPVKEKTRYALSYPLTLTSYIPQEKQRITLIFEKNSTNHFILSGTLPDSYYLFINGSIIKPNQSNEFFFKVPIPNIEKEQLLEFLIFKNTVKK